SSGLIVLVLPDSRREVFVLIRLCTPDVSAGRIGGPAPRNLSPLRELCAMKSLISPRLKLVPCIIYCHMLDYAAWPTKKLSVTSLLLDQQNPRLPQSG